MARIVDIEEPVTPRVKPPPAQPQADTPPPPPEDLRRPHTPDERKLAEALGAGYQAIGGGLVAIGMRLNDPGLQGTGIKTMETAPAIAAAWIDLSRRNPAVKAWLKKITEVSAVGMVVGMHVACAIPLLASRGILPASMADTDAPAMTEEELAAFNAMMNGSG